MKLLWVAAVVYTVLCAYIQSTESRGLDGRIVSGSKATPGQFPWHVIIQGDEEDGVHCGGSIISDTWVLTAAHCTVNRASIFMIFGTVDANVYTISQTSEKIFEHPQFYRPTLTHDISLIKLATPLTFNELIQPIALASQSGDSFLGVRSVVSGYGIDDDEYINMSNYLQYAQLVVIENAKCLEEFGDPNVTNGTLCALGANGSNQSPCVGDSGGPLVTRDTNGLWQQIGIASFVKMDRCTESLPSAFVRITAELDYIKETIGLNS